jgi:hypothetical protein
MVQCSTITFIGDASLPSPDGGHARSAGRAEFASPGGMLPMVRGINRSADQLPAAGGVRAGEICDPVSLRSTPRTTTVIEPVATRTRAKNAGALWR